MAQTKQAMLSDNTKTLEAFNAALESHDWNGAVTMSAWHTISTGKHVSGRVGLDMAALRALVPNR
jgi:hypothetical protein